MDDVRRQLHNEAVMEQMKEIERDVGGAIDDANIGSSTDLSPQGPTGDQAVEPSGPLTPTAQAEDSPEKARDGG